jgi:hypothetical protein
MAGMNTPSPQRPATLLQASRALGLPTDWLREEASAGRVPCLRVGPDRFVFDLEQLRSLILDRVRRGDGPPAGEEAKR